MFHRWNQGIVQNITERNSSTLEDIDLAIRKISKILNDRIDILQQQTDSGGLKEIEEATNLRNCVQSAASVYGSASTTLGVAASDYGDCFPPEREHDTKQWVERNMIQEEDTQDSSSEDEDFESDLTCSLFISATEKWKAQDLDGAERDLRICHSRLSVSFPNASGLGTSNNSVVTKIGVLDALFTLYKSQENWQEAQNMAAERLAFRKDSTEAKYSQEMSSDIFDLAEVMFKQKSYVEAQTQARRALRGYTKLGVDGKDGVEKSLDLLIQICADGDDHENLHTYTAHRSIVLSRKDSAAALGLNIDNIPTAFDPRQSLISLVELQRSTMRNFPAQPQTDSIALSDGLTPKDNSNNLTSALGKNSKTALQPTSGSNPAELLVTRREDTTEAILRQSSIEQSRPELTMASEHHPIDDLPSRTSFNTRGAQIEGPPLSAPLNAEHGWGKQDSDSSGGEPLNGDGDRGSEREPSSSSMDPVRSAYAASHYASAAAPLLSSEVLPRRQLAGLNSTHDEENPPLKDAASESTTLVESTHGSKGLENEIVVSGQKTTQYQETASADSVANHIRKNVRIGLVGERGCGMTSLTM